VQLAQLVRGDKRSLKERFNPRDNSIGFVRMVLAAIVVICHAQSLAWNKPVLLGRSQVGDLAVDGFFVVSGFLVTRSATNLPTLRRYFTHRALRILPAFYLTLFVTAFVVAPLVAVLQGDSVMRAFTGWDSNWKYVIHNCMLLVRQWTIGGLGPDGPTGPPPMNGSLWTLFYEALCYCMIAFLVAVGVIRRKTRPPTTTLQYYLPALVAGGAWALYAAQAYHVAPAGPQNVGRFVITFLFGAMGHLYADKIRFTPAWVAVALAGCFGALFLSDDYLVLGSLPFAYLFWWAMVSLPIRWTTETDLSYGLYIFHWPTEMILIAAGATRRFGELDFAFLAMVIAGIGATFSWHFVESRALRYKNTALPDRAWAWLETQVTGRVGQRHPAPEAGTGTPGEPLEHPVAGALLPAESSSVAASASAEASSSQDGYGVRDAYAAVNGYAPTADGYATSHGFGPAANGYAPVTNGYEQSNGYGEANGYADGYADGYGQEQGEYAANGYAQNGHAQNGYAQNGHGQNGYAPNGHPADEDAFTYGYPPESQQAPDRLTTLLPEQPLGDPGDPAYRR